MFQSRLPWKDAMSRQAKSERQVAEKSGEAAETMQLGGLAEPTVLSACLGQESAQRAGAAGPCSQANPAKRQSAGPKEGMPGIVKGE